MNIEDDFLSYIYFPNNQLLCNRFEVWVKETFSLLVASCDYLTS